MGHTVRSMERNTLDKGIMIRKKEKEDIVIALAGNPNVGKSTVFNALTGLHQHTGNWIGKTVASAQGYRKERNQGFVIVDIPGCYSLNPHTAEEEVASEFLHSGEADVIIAVCDASCLERNMILVLQLLDLTQRLVVCINLMDEAAKKKIKIDCKGLSDRLGVPVIPAAASRGEGIEELLRAARHVVQSPESKGRKELECACKNDGYRTLKQEQIEFYIHRSEQICRGAITYENLYYSRSDRRKDRIFTGKVTAMPIMLLLLFFLFWLTIAGANGVSDFLQKLLSKGESILHYLLIQIGMPQTITALLIEGVYRVAAWVVAVMLPPMAIFFPLFTLLEDAGYLPRVAYNLDKCFQKCHACGKQCLTMAMGLGCNAAGVVGCRIIDSPRERLIAILTNCLMPCNGRFPMLILLCSMLFAVESGKLFGSALAMTGVLLIGVMATFFMSRILSATVLKGVPSSFTLELPPYRRPQIASVLFRSVTDRVVFVLGRALVSAVPAGALIWIGANTIVGDMTLLAHLASFFDPFGRLLGMDGVILLAFLIGLPANELVIPLIAMIYLGTGSLQDAGDFTTLHQLFIQNGWTWITIVSTILFALIHWPCATTGITIYKETKSMKWTALAYLIPAVMGILVCFFFASAARILFGK